MVQQGASLPGTQSYVALPAAGTICSLLVMVSNKCGTISTAVAGAAQSATHNLLCSMLLQTSRQTFIARVAGTSEVAHVAGDPTEGYYVPDWHGQQDLHYESGKPGALKAAVNALCKDVEAAVRKGCEVGTAAYNRTKFEAHKHVDCCAVCLNGLSSTSIH